MRLFLRIRMALRLAAVDAVNQALLLQGELNAQVIKGLTRIAGVAASRGGLAIRTRPMGLGSYLTSSPILLGKCRTPAIMEIHRSWATLSRAPVGLTQPS